MDAQKKVQELVYIYDTYEKKLNEIMVLRESLEKKKKEYEVVMKSIDGIRDSSSECILPLSSDAFVIVHTLSKDKLLVNIGSNVIVEMKYEKALEYFQDLKLKIEKEIERVDNMINSIVNEMEKIRNELENYEMNL